MGYSSEPLGPLTPPGTYPGQGGNPVGFAAAPGYPGSLTASGPFTPAANTTYSFLDIDTGPSSIADGVGGGMSINADNVTFYGCRIQCNDVGITVPPRAGNATTGGCAMFIGNSSFPNFTASMSAGVMTVTQPNPWGTAPVLVVGQTVFGTGVPSGTTITSFGTGTGQLGTYNISTSATVGSEAMTAFLLPNDVPKNSKFIYCSFTPRTAVVTQPPNGIIWPSNGVGVPGVNTTKSAQPYGIGQDQGYQFAIVHWGDSLTVDHCDIWGFGNSIQINTQSPLGGSILIKDTWFHDAAWDGDGNDTSPWHIHYHTDGPGYESLGGPPTIPITIEHCVVAIFGGANAIAFQGLNGGLSYNNITVNDCWLSGASYTIDIGHNITTCTNMRFTNNIWSSGMQAIFGTVPFNDLTFGGQNRNLWYNNKFNYWPGTAPGPTGYNPQWTPSQDGQYVLPDLTISATDWHN